MRERLALAYSRKSQKETAIDIIELLKLCLMVENKHFKCFAGMLYDYFYGIIAYAAYRNIIRHD